MNDNFEKFENHVKKDLEFSRCFLDVIFFANSHDDFMEIFQYFTKKLFEMTDCDQIIFRDVTKSNMTKGNEFVTNKDPNNVLEVKKSFKTEIVIHGKEMGELVINYFNPFEFVDEMMREGLPVIKDYCELVITRSTEKAERKKLKFELEQSQVASIISAMSEDYGNVTYVDLIKGTDRVVKQNNAGILSNEDKNNDSYNVRIANYVENFIVPEEREEMAEKLSLQTGIEKTKNGKPYLINCHILIGGQVHYSQS